MLASGIARDTDIRRDLQNGAGRFAYVLGLTVTILNLVKAPGLAGVKPTDTIDDHVAIVLGVARIDRLK